MCRSNFRIKLDLCKFFNDVRRFCWIFVDSTRMLRVAHAMDHITKLFNIKEPFHMLLNEAEYLPPNEDIRILKENETILVCPGTGLHNETNVHARVTNRTPPVPEVQNSFTKSEVVNSTVINKESQTNFYPVQPEPVDEKNELIEVLDRSQSDTLETSTLCEKTEDKTDSTSESKTDGQILTDFNLDNGLCPKRKRKRTRKKKTQVDEPSVENKAIATKPKIINTYVISSCKHIRFDNVDSPETVEKPNTPNKKMNGSYTNEVAPSHELANLLSLGHTSTPVTFTNPQVKEEIKLENVSDEEITQCNTSFENEQKSNNLVKQLQEGKELSSKDLAICPVLVAKPELKCIMAFKMLKIGSNYTPQVSEFIVAEVVSYCPKSLLYTFKVLQGLSEIQVPVGKFTLIEDDEERTLNDTITINIAQLIEPRIVSAVDPDRVSTPPLD